MQHLSHYAVRRLFETGFVAGFVAGGASIGFLSFGFGILRGMRRQALAEQTQQTPIDTDRVPKLISVDLHEVLG